jgi:hypothetical protein
MNNSTSCENCLNYGYNEEYNCYECQVHLDEDDLVRFLTSTVLNCPHFQFDDEYTIVKKQI